MSYRYAFWLTLVLGISVPGAAVLAADTGPKIRKCQDTTGKWHYGDSAAEECARSKIIEISEQGTKKKEIAAPLTEKELEERAQRKGAEEEQLKQTQERAKKDELLLSAYAHEDDIVYVRDRKIAQIDTLIRASEETLKSLRAALTRMETQATDEKAGNKSASEQTSKAITQTQQQIAKHEEAIVAKRQEQETLRRQYATEIERYRELKKSPSKVTAAPSQKQ